MRGIDLGPCRRQRCCSERASESSGGRMRLAESLVWQAAAEGAWRERSHGQAEESSAEVTGDYGRTGWRYGSGQFAVLLFGFQ